MLLISFAFLSVIYLKWNLSNGDGDGNEDGKKVIGLDWQNNSLARASRFLYISLPSLYVYDVKLPNLEDGNS